MKSLNEKLILEPYEIFSVRGKNYIIIFPEIPFWIAVSQQGFLALEEMKLTGSIENVARKVFGSVKEDSVAEV